MGWFPSMMLCPCVCIHSLSVLPTFFKIRFNMVMPSLCCFHYTIDGLAVLVEPHGNCPGTVEHRVALTDPHIRLEGVHEPMLHLFHCFPFFLIIIILKYTVPSRISVILIPYFHKQGHFMTYVKWWRMWGTIPRPSACKADALANCANPPYCFVAPERFELPIRRPERRVLPITPKSSISVLGVTELNGFRHGQNMLCDPYTNTQLLVFVAEDV